MNYWLKIIIPVSLGIAAAGVNYAVMQFGMSDVYVQVLREVAEGDPIDRNALSQVRLWYGGVNLQKAAVRWEDRALLYDRPATRKLEPGDLVLYRDAGQVRPELALKNDEVAVGLSLSEFEFDYRLLRVGNKVGFFVVTLDEEKLAKLDGSASGTPAGGDAGSSLPFGADDARLPTKRVLLGPFEIVSVGARTDEEEAFWEASPLNERPQTIAVAVKIAEKENVMSQLGGDLIIAKNRRKDEIGSIKSMVLYPANRPMLRGAGKAK